MDAGPQSNGFNREITESLLREIRDADDRLASLKGEYMASCKPIHNDIKEIFKQAKHQGLPIRAFKAIVKNDRLARKAEAVINELEDDDRDSYAAIHAGLGPDFAGLPLGQAALQKARPSTQLDSLAAG